MKEKQSLLKKKNRIRTFRYPNPDRIEINQASLELKIKEYKNSINKKLGLSDILLIISSWAILLNKGTFDDFWLLGGDELKGFYMALIFCITVYMIFTKTRIYKWIYKDDEDIKDLLKEIKSPNFDK